MRRAIIVDIDGTLANCDHRQWIVKDRPYEKKDYDYFYQNLENDEPYHFCKEIIRRFIIDHKIIFITGRPKRFEQATRQWLWKHVGLTNQYEIFFKEDDDLRHDTDFKSEVYFKKIRDSHQIVLVLEDRTALVKMWRDLGLMCYQVQQSDF